LGTTSEEESELEYLTEIRGIRDNQPDLFSRIKRLPKKARSTRLISKPNDIGIKECPSLITYFRQGRLDKFFLAGTGTVDPSELDFFNTVHILKPTSTVEKLQPIPHDFYILLDKNKKAFETATSQDVDDIDPRYKGGANDAYILKRLKTKEIRLYHGFTEDDELYIRQVIQLLTDGALPRPTTKKVADDLKKEMEPIKVLGILKRDIPYQFFQATRSQQTYQAFKPREVILSSYVLEDNQ